MYEKKNKNLAQALRVRTSKTASTSKLPTNAEQHTSLQLSVCVFFYK